MGSDSFQRFHYLERLFDAVGRIHYQGERLRVEEQDIVDRVVAIVNATNKAKGFELADAVSREFFFDSVSRNMDMDMNIEEESWVFLF